MRAGQLRTKLSETRERLLSVISGVSEEQFKRRPADEGWCIAEVLAHLLSWEGLQVRRIRLALESDGAPIDAVDPDWQQSEARKGRTAPVPQLIHGLLATRRETERLLDQAGEAGLQRAVTHPELGSQSVELLLSVRVADHEAEHVQQIEALRAEFGIRHTG